MKKIRMIVCFLIIICLVITTKNVHAVTLKEYEDKVAFIGKDISKYLTIHSRIKGKRSKKSQE